MDRFQYRERGGGQRKDIKAHLGELEDRVSEALDTNDTEKTQKVWDDIKELVSKIDENKGAYDDTKETTPTEPTQESASPAAKLSRTDTQVIDFS